MGEKNKNHLPLDEEKVLDFQIAKDLTIEEAVKKHKEIEAGVTEEDGVLDRYIKQHREEIESQKFETKSYQAPIVDSNLTESLEANEPSTEVVAETELLEETIVAGVSPLDIEDTVEQEADLVSVAEEDVEEGRKKNFYFGFGVFGAVLLLIGIVASAFVWFQSVNQSTKTTASSTSQTSSSTSVSSKDTAMDSFEQLYKSFFTDTSLTKLKNSEFGKLAELKTLLEKLDKNSDNYKRAKEQYDTLEKAIAAIQTINSQFDKAVVSDGELDTTATVKTDATLSAIKTGISSVDSLLASVVNFGRSQQEKAQATAVVTDTSSDNGQSVESTSAQESVSVSEMASSDVKGASVDFGISVPPGVVLQRELSRVPYDQTMIDDTANTAWTFTPGILENIIAISQQRGYITGNQFILEKVNVINGNGYYNMFKPDGTYLFSINCKTGYFVGNGAGYADALDY